MFVCVCVNLRVWLVIWGLFVMFWWFYCLCEWCGYWACCFAFIVCFLFSFSYCPRNFVKFLLFFFVLVRICVCVVCFAFIWVGLGCFVLFCFGWCVVYVSDVFCFDCVLCVWRDMFDICVFCGVTEFPANDEKFEYSQFVSELNNKIDINNIFELDERLMTLTEDVKNDIKNKYGFAKYNELPINPITKEVDFNFGKPFMRDGSINIDTLSLMGLNYESMSESPTVSNKPLIDSIPTHYAAAPKLFPFIQVSKAGKSYCIRQFAANPNNRWVLLVDFLPTSKHSGLVKLFFDRCQHLRNIASNKIGNSKADSAVIEIYKSCFQHTVDTCNNLLVSSCIHLLLYIDYCKKNDFKPNALHYFDITKNSENQARLREDIFSLLTTRGYDGITVKNEILALLKVNLDSVPVYVIDECGVLSQTNGSGGRYLARRMFAGFDNSNWDDIINFENGELKEYRSIFDPFAESTIKISSLFGIPCVIAGTTMRVSKLVEGYASPYKGREMVLCNPIMPLSGEDVSNVIKEYLNIDAPDYICERWRGRCGLLIDGLILPFLATMSSNQIVKKEEWTNEFINYEKLLFDNKNGGKLIIRHLNDAKILNSLVKYDKYPYEMTIGEALARIYHDLIFRGPDQREFKNLNFMVPYLVEYGLAYMSGVSDNLLGFKSNIIESQALDGLDLLFRLNDARNDKLLKLMLDRYYSVPGVAGSMFENLIAYILIRNCGKKLSEIHIFKSLTIKHNNLSDYKLCGFRFIQETSAKKDRFVEKMVDEKDSELNTYWISSVRSHEKSDNDLMGIAINEKNEKLVIIIQCKRLSNGHNARDSANGINSIYSKSFEIEGDRKGKDGKKSKESRNCKPIWDDRMASLKSTKYIGIFISGDSNVQQVWNFGANARKFLDGITRDETFQGYIDHVYFRDVCSNEKLEL